MVGGSASDSQIMGLGIVIIVAPAMQARFVSRPISSSPRGTATA